MRGKNWVYLPSKPCLFKIPYRNRISGYLKTLEAFSHPPLPQQITSQIRFHYNRIRIFPDSTDNTTTFVLTAIGCDCKWQKIYWTLLPNSTAPTLCSRIIWLSDMFDRPRLTTFAAKLTQSLKKKGVWAGLWQKNKQIFNFSSLSVKFSADLQQRMKQRA